MDLGDLALPDFHLEVPIGADQLEIGAIAGDQTRAAGASGQGDQDVEVQVAEFMGLKALVIPDFCKDYAGFKPVVAVGVRIA